MKTNNLVKANSIKTIIENMNKRIAELEKKK